MTEQKIEQKVMSAMQSALTAAAQSGIEIIGAWQPAAQGDEKGVETDTSRGYLTVKVSPRRHDTFTIAEASFDVAVSINMRTETDADGSGYLSVTDACASAIYSWQKSFATYNSAFEIQGEFAPTGFRIDGGDCGVDRQNSVWTWIQNFTVQGIIEN